MSDEPKCGTCRWWNIRTQRGNVGDCMRGHRHSRVPMRDGSFALLDSFGSGDETKRSHTCDAWEK